MHTLSRSNSIFLQTFEIHAYLRAPAEGEPRRDDWKGYARHMDPVVDRTVTTRMIQPSHRHAIASDFSYASPLSEGMDVMEGERRRGRTTCRQI